MFHLPKIRLEIENMKYQVIHLLSQHNDEIEAEVERCVERAIASYPFESEIMLIAKDAISQSIKESIVEYFRYGEGKKFIEQVVLKSVKGLIEEK